MKKLYEVTRIDENDNVTREFVTANSKRDKRFKDKTIVKIEEIKLPIDDIITLIKKSKLAEEIKTHLINIITEKEF